MKHLLPALIISCMSMGSAIAHSKNKSTAAFTTKSFIIADSDGTIIEEKDKNTILPIASITKLMVGLLASEQDLTENLDVPVHRTVQTSIPKNIKKLSRHDLIVLAMVRSDNFAAQILCTNLPLCTERMNQKSAELGMTDTRFVEPTGLSKENTSTASDLLKLVMAAANNEVVSNLSSMPGAEITTGGRSIKIKNTNPLVYSLDITLSKTGYTRPAGGCIVMIINSNYGEKILILLGSKNARTRIPDVKRLLKDHGIY